MSERIETYEEFFPYYLREHSLPVTRGFHYVGTTLFLASLIAFFVTFHWGYLVFALVIGYLFAWIGHFFVEHNRPATFSYPGWSFISDLKMYFLFITGQLGKHLQAAGVGVVIETLPEPSFSAAPGEPSDPEAPAGSESRE